MGNRTVPNPSLLAGIYAYECLKKDNEWENPSVTATKKQVELCWEEYNRRKSELSLKLSQARDAEVEKAFSLHLQNELYGEALIDEETLFEIGLYFGSEADCSITISGTDYTPLVVAKTRADRRRATYLHKCEHRRKAEIVARNRYKRIEENDFPTRKLSSGELVPTFKRASRKVSKALR